MRRYKIKIDDLEVVDLRVTFKIEKLLSGMPNKCELKIYNLKQSNRDYIKNVAKRVEIFINDILLFKGNITRAYSLKSKTEWISQIFIFDGNLDLYKSINKSVPKGSSQMDVFNQVIDEATNTSKGMLNGIKNCISKKRSLLKKIYLSGSIKEFLDRLSKDCGFDYSINSDKIDTVPKTDLLRDLPIFVINQANGMIGSPEINLTGSKVKTLLNPILEVGRGYKLEALNMKINMGNDYFSNPNAFSGKGVYKITKISHYGDTHGNDGYSEIEGVHFV